MKIKTRISIVAILLLISVLLTACNGAYSADTFTSVEDYSTARDKCVPGYGLQIIPRKINERDAKKLFASKKTYLPVGEDYQLFLEMNYSQDDFDYEIERLKRVQDVRKVKYDIENFNYPAYVAEMGLSNAFEYALVDEEHLVVYYVYMEYIIHREDLEIDEEFLPKTYTEQLEDFDGKFKDYNYSIYNENFEDQYGY